MGDRGNIVVKEGESKVWLYTHWGGSRLPQILQRALARRLRWNDAPYLARIIFCEMLRGQEDGGTGFGIWTGPCDNEHEVLVADCDRQRVLTYKDETLKEVVGSQSFAEFAGQALPVGGQHGKNERT